MPPKNPDRDLGFVEQVKIDFLECRSMRHQFSLVYFGPLSGTNLQTRFSPSIIVRITRCRRCRVHKEDFFNPTNASRAAMGLSFSAFHRRYRYPEGYAWDSTAASGEKPTFADYNYELYQRFNKEK